MAGNSTAATMMKEAAALMDDAGLTVLASSGWESRGRSSDVSYWAVLAHHTASTYDSDSVLINGRSDLPGPLCNWALHDNGDWVLIASGRANHAGEGTLSNSESQGIEATGPHGYPDTYGPAAFHNYDEYEVGCACLLAAMDAQVNDLFGHKETARPVGRKIDPYFDMDPFRAGVKSGELEDDMPPYRQWENGDKQALLDDIWRMISRGEKIDGSKPSQIVNGSIGELRARQDLHIYGDGQDKNLSNDTHAKWSVMRLHERLMSLIDRLEAAGVIAREPNP